MTAGKFALYVLLIFGVSSAIVFAQFALHKRTKWWTALICLGIKFALSILFALLAVAITSPFGWNVSPLTVALYLTCLGDAVADLIAMIFVLIKKKPMNVWIRCVAGIVLTMSVMTYGMINMQIVTGKDHTYYSEKLDHEYTVVFLADLHYGSAQSVSVVDKALSEIKEKNPDLILLGGDITDEYTTKEEMAEIYRKIGALGIKTYYIYGNHDRQPKASHAHGATYSDDELRQTIADNGITLLCDEYDRFADDLVILGREDYSAGDGRKKVEELEARPTDAYVINVDHSPYQYDDIEKTKADLQLSGHTHGGQYFPIGFDLGLFVHNVYGEYQKGDTHLFVTSGFSGWHDPFRTQKHCNYEVIRLVPKKEAA